MIVPLTSLRGLAALAVMGYHFSWVVPGLGVFGRGFLGVDLFFLLSGFILTHVYRQRLGAWSFFAARFARTYPLHLFMILLMLPALGRTPAFSPAALACNLTMTQVVCGGPLSWNGVSWSLSAEWLSYLLFPLLLAPFLRCPRWVGVILVLCCAGVLLSLSPIVANDSYGARALGRSLPEFLIGMLLYRAYQDRWLAHWGWFAASVTAMVVALALRLPDIVVLASFAAAILSGPYVRPMEHPALVFLGEISYSLYMVHLLVGFSVVTAFRSAGVAPGLLSGVAAAGLSMLFATAIYRCVELPARAALRRWLTARPARPGLA